MKQELAPDRQAQARVATALIEAGDGAQALALAAAGLDVAAQARAALLRKSEITRERLAFAIPGMSEEGR